MNLENEQLGHAAPVIESDELRAIVQFDPLLTVKEITEQLGEQYLIVSRHWHALDKLKKLYKWFTHDFTEQNLKSRLKD